MIFVNINKMHYTFINDLVLFQLNRLQTENDSLVNKHSKYSEQLQEETINLPNTVEVSVDI